jgi:hypothetical protein
MAAMQPEPFVKQPLRSPSWWRWLLGLPAAGNARIALENLLAEGRGGVAEISRALRPYQLGGGDVRRLLNHAYAKALVHCLSDDSITEGEHRFLMDLRRRLGLSDTEVVDLHAATIHPRFERAVAEVLSDAHITDREREGLLRLQESLRLPEAVRSRIYSSVATSVLQRAYETALSDRRLSPEEEADLKAMAENLDVAPNLSQASLAVMERYRLLWRIENGDIPLDPVEVRLLSGETCHFHAAADWRELRTTSHRAEAGPPPGTPVVRGVRFRMGTLAPAVQRAETLTQVDTGTLYFTNKRLFFRGVSNSRTIRLGKILGYQVFSDAIVVEKDQGRSPYLFVKGDIELAAVVLGAVLERA